MEKLPKKWAIKIEEPNIRVLRKYWKSLKPDLDYSFKGHIVFPKYDSSHLCYGDAIEWGYEILTFEQFERLILNKSKETKTLTNPNYEIY